jgi:hypothetical protein
MRGVEAMGLRGWRWRDCGGNDNREREDEAPCKPLAEAGDTQCILHFRSPRTIQAIPQGMRHSDGGTMMKMTIMIKLTTSWPIQRSPFKAQ